MKSILNVARPFIPQKALPILAVPFRIYMKFLCWYTGLWDKKHIKRIGFDCVPPASLRYRVHGSPDIDSYLQMGKQISQGIESELAKIGKELNTFQNILDFGCGCGRTLMWLTEYSPQSHFYGTDIDYEAILWCQQHLSFAEFNVNEELPPLKYSSETFDLIWAISVFTHLNEDHQFHWLNELRRIARSEGIILITVHGEHSWKNLPRKDVDKIKKEGFLFITSNTTKGIFPEWYQAAYHTEKYIFDKYSAYFSVLNYVPGGLDKLQDLVILQKSNAT